jgi:hypothetical protein
VPVASVRDAVTAFGIDRFTVPEISARCGMEPAVVAAALTELAAADEVAQVLPDSGSTALTAHAIRPGTTSHGRR